MYLAKNIRKFRKLSGLTLEELAEKVGCSKNYIFEIETGKKNNPSFKLVAKIANTLDVAIDQLASPPLKSKNAELDAFFRNFRKLTEENQQGIIAQVNKLMTLKKSKK